jgi:hypothetical protein
MRTLLTTFAVLLLLGGSAVAADGAAPIGTLKKLESNGFIWRGQDRIAAKIGAPVYEKDILETDDNGSMGVAFVDNTRVSVGPKSKLTLNQYVYSPKQGKFAFAARIAKGTMSYVSGNIAKKAPDSVAVHTPNATIGIRGTKFVVELIEE